MRSEAGLQAGAGAVPHGAAFGADRSRVPVVVLLLFFFSGAAGLIYQVVWTRYLATVLGSTTQAISAVVAAFMGGLALGAFVAGRSRRSGASAIQLYGILEILIGLYALSFPLLLGATDELYVRAYPAISGQAATTLAVRVLLSLGLLVLPTSLMGATLPILIVGVVRAAEAAARPIAAMYGINTIGAVAGTLASGFVLIPFLGVRSSLHLAVAINVVVGVVAIALAQRLAARAGASGPGAPGPAPRIIVHELSPETRRSWRWLALIVGVSGFASIGLEVAWTRALVLFTGNSTYAFATILATYLAGIGLGSLMAASPERLRGRPYWRLGLLQMAIGVLSLAPALILSHGYYALAERFEGMVNVWATGLGVKLLEAAAVLFVPALLMGISLPLALALGSRDLGNTAQATGSLYAINTVCAIAGSILAGFVLIPALGSLRTTAVLAAMYLASGAGLVLFARRRESTRAGAWGWLMAAAAVPMAALTLTDAQPLSVLKDPSTRREYESRGGGESVYYNEGVNTLSEVVTDKRDGRPTLYVDGIKQMEISFEVLQLNMRLAQLPLLVHENPREVLIIASGVGVTSGAALDFAEVERVVSVEIAGEVEAATHLFGPVNNNLVEDGRNRTIVDDGRHYLRTTARTFDVISTSAIHPKLSSGNASLYRREYFELLLRRLSAGGLCCQWVPLDMAEREIRDVVRTFASVFPYASLWFVKAASDPGKWDVLLLGSREEHRFEVARVAARMEQPRAREKLARTGLQSVYELLGSLIVEGEALRAWAGPGGRVYSDDRPGLEFERSAYEQARSILFLLDARREPRGEWVEWPGDAGEAQRMRQEWSAYEAFLAALLAGERKLLGGDAAGAMQDYLRARSLRPGDPDGEMAVRRAQYRLSGSAGGR